MEKESKGLVSAIVFVTLGILALVLAYALANGWESMLEFITGRMAWAGIAVGALYLLFLAFSLTELRRRR